jgi:hypothetical protein
MTPRHDEINERRRIGVEITCSWQDSDVLEIRVGVTNGVFAGLAYPYVSHVDLQNAAAGLNGFPTNFQDSREVGLGDRRDRFAGGFVSFLFTARDSAGHCAVEVQITSKNDARAEPRWNRVPQTVTLIAGVDADAIASFANDLRRLGETKSGTAWLQFSKP